MTVTVPYIMVGHRIAAWTSTLRIATKILGITHALARPESESTAAINEDEVASPFS